ncbi:MAG: beta-ketoacyl-ACP synthase II, partial [Clostridia bacterium]|nr:beta-ketoacyl-ACP synthase II [Clostridia bacterium]
MRRAVITGMGAVTPLGNSVKELWESVEKGRLGILEIDYFDASDFKIKVSAPCHINVEEYLVKHEIKRNCRFLQLGIIEADEEIKQAGIAEGLYKKERMGIVTGSSVGGILVFEREIMKPDVNTISPFTVPTLLSNMLSGILAIRYGCKGHCAAVNTACSTGNNAIGEGAELIKSGRLDMVIVGGSEAALGKPELAAFANMMALSKAENPKRASIPFDKERNGFVMGEGAGILILEEYECAKKRGASIICEVAGYGSTCDAFHPTAPNPSGEGAARAILQAIESAGLAPKDIDYINAHGTSTPINDSMETKAIKTVFGEQTPYVSSTKSMMGHLLGAAGAVEAIICAKAIEEGVLPPNIGYEAYDAECDLNLV